MKGMKNNSKANLPAAILVLAILMFWQGAAMGVVRRIFCRRRCRWWCGCGSCGDLCFRHIFRLPWRWWLWVL